MRKCKKCGSENLSVRITKTQWLDLSIEQYERETEYNLFGIDLDDYGGTDWEMNFCVRCNDCGNEEVL